MPSLRKKVRKDGSITYTWRGTVPYRKADGTIDYKPVERGTGAGTKREAWAEGKRIERQYHERANLPLAVEQEDREQVTFAMAALSYMQAGGERTYLAPILERIGNMPLSEITQEVVQELASAKEGCKASYINRIIFTPILAVMNHGAKLKMCPPPILIRPKGHDKSPALKLPGEDWFRAIWPHLSESKRAATLLITLHGLRISEALKRTPADLDMARSELSIPDTKTGEPALIALSEPVLEAIREIPNWPNQKWLFGTCHASNYRKSIVRACKAAGQPSYGSHAIGRHSFSTRILQEGKSLKFLMNAGRWKTAKMPMQRYGHLEQSEVQSEVKDIAARWRGTEADADVVSLAGKRATKG